MNKIDGEEYISELLECYQNSEPANYTARSLAERISRGDNTHADYMYLLARAEAAECHIRDANEGAKAIVSRVIQFASQLQAWGHEAAANELLNEVLGGQVNAPDYHKMKARAEAAEDALAQAREGLQQIVAWSEAYPSDVFPEPDFAKARRLLEAGGITLDSVAASNMRHVITGVAQIAKAALDAAGEKRWKST